MLKNSSVAIASAATFAVAGAMCIASAPSAFADAAAPGTNSVSLGSPANIGGQSWTVSDLKQSSDAIPYQAHGTLWEATATDEAVQGGATPLISDLNATSPGGQTYRVLYQVATPQGISPAGLAQGQKATGKVYFDVTGDNPNEVVYREAGGQDLATWVQPTAPAGGTGGRVTTSGTGGQSTSTPGNKPVTSAGNPAAAGSQGTPIPAGSQGTPASGAAPAAPATGITPPAAGTPAAPPAAGTPVAPPAAGTPVVPAPAGSPEVPAGAPAPASPAEGTTPGAPSPATAPGAPAPAGGSEAPAQAPGSPQPPTVSQGTPASAGTPADSAPAPTGQPAAPGGTAAPAGSQGAQGQSQGTATP